jgi:hypothetical protein
MGFTPKEPDLLPNLLLTLSLLYFSRRILDTSLLFEEINIVSAISTLIIVFVRSRKNIHFDVRKVKESIVMFLAVSFLVNSVMLNIDRSRSFYVLSWVANGQVYIDSGDHKLMIRSPEGMNVNGVYQRVEENKARGFIIESGDKYALSFTGKIFLDITNIIAKTYELKNWDINKN